MKINNEIAYCLIVLPHKGELDFTRSLNMPIAFNSVLDETLNTATVKLTDLRQSDYPNIDVGKAFEPFTLVKIGFKRQLTEIRMVIAKDTARLQRKDGRKSWTHTLQLVEETKQLERESVDVLTFTNPLERRYDSKASLLWMFDGSKSCYRTYNFGVVGKKTGDVDENILKKYVGWIPPSLPMMISKTESYTIRSNLNTFNYNRTDSYAGGLNIVSYKLNITTPSNKKFSYDFNLKFKIDGFYRYEDSSIDVPFNQVGEYKIEYFMRVNTSRNDGTGSHLTDIFYYSYIAVGSNQEQIRNYTLADVLCRTLDLTPLRKKGEPNRYKFEEVQLDEYSTEESPEFAFTGHTLFEALLLVAQYKGAFPELKGNTIFFRTLWNGITLKESELPPCIDELNYSDIDQYCTYLDTDVQNLVGMNNSRVSTVTEPYAAGYKTTRSNGDSEISEDTAVIQTSYKIYQSIKLEIGPIGDKIINENDLSAYVYEQREYDGLSDYTGAYPNSKGYALKWQQMAKNYSELAHRIKSSNSISEIFKNPAIANIISAKTGESQESAVVKYFKNLVGINDGNSFADLMFRMEYVPVINARIKQYKDYFGEFHHDGSIKYNQTAELVDSEMYGEHLKQLMRKIGNATKRCIYIFKNIDQVPKLGTLVDGYSIYDLQLSIRENEVIATVSFVKYAELSKYIGIKNAWKDSDVSTNKCYNRAISYNEFLLFSNNGNLNSTSESLTQFGRSLLIPLDNNVNSKKVTCVEAIGYYVDGSPLNAVILPVVGLAMGTSICFHWQYEDNYSAGYMSDNAPDGATNTISGTKYNRAQKAVRYCDMYGRIETYDFKLFCCGAIENDIEKMREIANSLPLVYEKMNIMQNVPILQVQDLLIKKNSSEALTVDIQLHYCTDNENFIIGSGLTNFCSLVGGEAQETGLFGFNERINIFKRRLSVGNATRLANINYMVNGSKRRIEITLPDTINNYSAWAYMGKDKNGNWQIIFGENRDLNGSDFKTELYLLPMHKLEDFI